LKKAIDSDKSLGIILIQHCGIKIKMIPEKVGAT
jgi:hypothetical protein